MKLSILIPTLPSRIGMLPSLLSELNFQIQSQPIEVLYLGDNKRMRIGSKRNKLLDLASGEFVCFLDDDDTIAHDYVSSIIQAIDCSPQPKVITFNGLQTSDGHQDLPFTYSTAVDRNFKGVHDGQRFKIMVPDHLCVWNRAIVKSRFPDKMIGEDHDWAKLMLKNYSASEVCHINKFLYNYIFNSKTTECRG